MKMQSGEFAFPPKEYKVGKKDTVLPYNWALGQTWIKFFEGLKREVILGTKCTGCNKTYVPARTFCPGCYRDMDEWVELSQEGSIETWCLVNYTYFNQIKDPPYIIAQIRLSGCDTSLTHFIDGFDMASVQTVKETMQKIRKVKAVWSKEKNGNIYDIQYFAPL